jgi:beta-glucosidase
MLELYSDLESPIQEGDVKCIFQPVDFVGLNIYTRNFIEHDPVVPRLKARFNNKRLPGVDDTVKGGEVHPAAIYEALMRFKKEWGDPSVYVTENGAAFEDRVVNGAVHDEKRTRYFQSYLAELHRAIREGVKVKGYFAWSLLDNFEWNAGYTERFGLIHVDFQSLERIPKDSAHWYRDLIETNGFEQAD